MNLRNKLYCIFNLIFALTMFYIFMYSPYLLLKYISLVLGVFDISILVFRIGLINYHKGLYDWVDE